ncbi:hypothetical protein LT493_21510 [Streptomyces tricolor]|nr:hypothetical protein [Streptomyces tricolor]
MLSVSPPPSAASPLALGGVVAAAPAANATPAGIASTRSWSSIPARIPPWSSTPVAPRPTAARRACGPATSSCGGIRPRPARPGRVPARVPGVRGPARRAADAHVRGPAGCWPVAASTLTQWTLRASSGAGSLTTVQPCSRAAMQPCCFAKPKPRLEPEPQP